MHSLLKLIMAFRKVFLFTKSFRTSIAQRSLAIEFSPLIFRRKNENGGNLIEIY